MILRGYTQSIVCIHAITEMWIHTKIRGYRKSLCVDTHIELCVYTHFQKRVYTQIYVYTRNHFAWIHTIGVVCIHVFLSASKDTELRVYTQYCVDIKCVDTRTLICVYTNFFWCVSKKN